MLKAPLTVKWINYHRKWEIGKNEMAEKRRYGIRVKSLVGGLQRSVCLTEGETRIVMC